MWPPPIVFFAIDALIFCWKLRWRKESLTLHFLPYYATQERDWGSPTIVCIRTCQCLKLPVLVYIQVFAYDCYSYAPSPLKSSIPGSSSSRWIVPSTRLVGFLRVCCPTPWLFIYPLTNHWFRIIDTNPPISFRQCGRMAVKYVYVQRDHTNSDRKGVCATSLLSPAANHFLSPLQCISSCSSMQRAQTVRIQINCCCPSY